MQIPDPLASVWTVDLPPNKPASAPGYFISLLYNGQVSTKSSTLNEVGKAVLVAVCPEILFSTLAEAETDPDPAPNSALHCHLDIQGSAITSAIRTIHIFTAEDDFPFRLHRLHSCHGLADSVA